MWLKAGQALRFLAWRKTLRQNSAVVLAVALRPIAAVVGRACGACMLFLHTLAHLGPLGPLEWNCFNSFVICFRLGGTVTTPIQYRTRSFVATFSPHHGPPKVDLLAKT